ncbi:uncharacterized protein LOC114938272 [Nylanderia fulva]|uniref:uncharacterized protein LOC114938272 n=1 Tax=Nylanderia fulva TaxID=613905 RepID=UPI0010FBA25B|nr:uncharacterized protein LOC114938272 [Nylanderia fulva]
MTLEALLDRQHELFGLIARACENLQKLGPSKTTRGAVQSRLTILKANWEKFQAQHENLYKLKSSELKKLDYIVDKIYEQCEEKFAEAQGTMLTILDSFAPPQQNTSAEISMNSSSASHSRRLPRIDLPKFNGEYSQWNHFRDLFASMINANTDLSAVEKLHYLKMSLSDEPATLLKGVEISSEGFNRAWDTLIDRYDNKRILIEAQLSALFSIRKAKSECASEVKRLLCELKEAIGALATLGCPVHHWDIILIFMTVRKLDVESVKEWEKSLGATSQPPSFADFEKFLLGRILTLEAFERTTNSRKQNASAPRSPAHARAYTATVTDQKCALCSSGHYIASCPKYLEKTPMQRKEVIISKNLCFNCLGPHQIKSCRSTKRCRLCHKQHHSTLHYQAGNADAIDASAAHSDSSTPVVKTITSSPPAIHTAGSEVSFVSESVAQLLKLSRQAAAIPILGIGAHRSSISNGLVCLKVISQVHKDSSLEVDALVLPKLTSYLPPARVEYTQWPHIQGLELADPNFATPEKIDLILSVTVHAQILKDGIRRGNIGEPIAQETTLGWVLSGPLSNDNQKTNAMENNSVIGLQCSLDSELLELLQRFWTQEEIAPASQISMSPEESQCEEHFNMTHSRDVNGRFVVRLPLKKSVSEFGDSRSIALKALYRMEKRFETNPSLKIQYIDFLREYRSLDHMRPVASNRAQSREFFLPHHGVTRETSTTTKLRVVFNGSQKTNLGLSLNEYLLVGPKLQTDLADILIRWRRHRYVFAADIEKMYRQIRVHEDDWPLQKILWRDSLDERPQEYALCTVTYGLACAPYLALRCLRQLALDYDSTRPHASETLRRDTYVDDILSGDESISQAKEKISQLRTTLTAGGFTLRKWIANDSNLLDDIPACDRETSPTLSVNDSAIHHTLGVRWERQSDSFVFSPPSLTISKNRVTKRSVLSLIARMFDPLGWITPITVTAKLFMQELWAIRLDWDDELPEDLKSRWTSYVAQLTCISRLAISRWFGTSASNLAVEVHGFADASQSALAAVVYLRVLSDIDDAQIKLICSKTKVAPLKRMTIPRLELSAAVLLVRQVLKIREVLELQTAPTHLWTDSTVALTWIKSHPSRWKDFVRNRVSFIQELSNSRWHHVSGKENPADLASRGVTPQRLQQNELWWTGPRWLHTHSTSWPSSIPILESTDNLEERPPQCTTAVEHHEHKLSMLDRYSSLTTLIRTTAWVQRALQLFRKSVASRSSHEPLTVEELESALMLWVKLTQQIYFSSEIKTLKSQRSLSTSSSLYRLTPFLDNEGLLRLRGRLFRSQLDPEEKHPLILPRKCRLSILVMDHHHRKTLHGGPQLTLSSIRQRFWIIGGRVPIRAFIHKCVICARHHATTGQQAVGQLPASRVVPRRPFFNSGVDYAGPLTLKTFRGRGCRTYKGYFIIFVCFSTSAIHLEVATDYSTDGFLAAFRRFTGRRGICSTLTSDCGTNLIGADAELKRMFTASSREWAHIANILANDGVKWSFNPPSAPHFEGKWEAGVKSVKFHLRRVLGDARLTYEELTTLLVQIEAILNSRPLTALSDDPSDSTALTPGHFLVGSTLATVPEPSLQEVPQNRLSRWQLLQCMKESFWQRWSSEYLQQLQTTSKQYRPQDAFRKGALVLIKDERFPPTKWPLARITDVHPGVDGLIRVATVKTATSSFKRPIVKLCLLPIETQ